MRDVKSIIYDFDGTLADTEAGIVTTFKASLERLAEPPVTTAEIKATIGLPLEQSFKIAAKLDDERAALACATYRELFQTVGIASIVLFDGVKESLEAFASRGIKLGIASSRHMASLVQISDMLGISHLFSAIYGVDMVKNPKPAPDTVIAAMDELGVSPYETVVVGDTIYDLQMGRNAGCRICGVTYGNHSRERLLTESPDWLIDDMRELDKLI